MSPVAEKVLQDAMALSPEERAELVNQLYQTLDQEIDPGIEAAWIEESERRYQRYINGETKVYSEEEARAYINSRLK